MSKNDGGSAFPFLERFTDIFDGEDKTLQHHGISVRDYFAAHATLTEYDLARMEDLIESDSGITAEVAQAIIRGEIADAMIAERSK